MLDMTNKAKSLHDCKNGEKNIWEDRRDWVKEVKAEEAKKPSKKRKKDGRPLLLRYF
jgi:hypothetical protein